jgi:hypothetical protein
VMKVDGMGKIPLVSIFGTIITELMQYSSPGKAVC